MKYMQILSLPKAIKILKIILWLIPVFLFIWIMNKHFVPSGKLEIIYQVDKENKLVKNFASKETERLIGTKNKPGDKDYFQIITASPVYFDVKVPRSFQKANVTLKYQNPDNQPLVQLGIKQANSAFYNINMAYLNPILENLPDYWDKIQEGNVILWQKNTKYFEEKKAKQDEYDKYKKELDNWKEEELNSLNKEFGINNTNQNILDTEKEKDFEYKKALIEVKYQQQLRINTEKNKIKERPEPKFSSIEEFLANLPEINKIVQYNYNLSNYIELPNYQKSYKTTEIYKSIRGIHDIYTYIGRDEDLNFTFTIQDINRHEGADPFIISIYNNQGVKVKEQTVPDDGDIKADGKVSSERIMQILMEKIPIGTYQFVIDTNDDIFIKDIITFQHLLIFKGNIYLTDNDEYKDILDEKKLEPTTIYTNSNSIRTRTSHDKGLQKIEIETGGKIKYLDIDVKHVLKELNNLYNITKIISPKNDVYIEGDGYFSFEKDQMFEPSFNTVASLDNVKDIETYDFIIANYPQAKLEGDWLVTSASVSTPYLYLYKNTDLLVNFIISLPGLPENDRILKIKEVDITFEKEPITIKNFISKFKNWLNKNIKLL